MPPSFSGPTLDQTERWLQAVIQHVGTDEEAIASLRATQQIPATQMPVTPSKTLTAYERVGVYREIYWLRLREALGIDYPQLKQFLGDEQFDVLCDEYVQKHPSRSYSLNRLGDHLPRFIAGGGFPPLGRRQGFAADLAKLELLMTEVFDEEDSAVLDETQVARIPAEAWETIKLKPIAALRVGEFRYPVSQYLTALRDEQPTEALLKRKDSFAIVSRRNYAVQRIELSRSAYRLFTALTGGATLGDAVSQVRVSPVQIQDWFKTWVANRVFRAV